MASEASRLTSQDKQRIEEGIREKYVKVAVSPEGLFRYPSTGRKIGSHVTCGPGIRRPARTSKSFSPQSDNANCITAHARCQRPLPGPPEWPHQVCTPDRHPQK
jgi:hypothetical protein